MRYKPHGYQEFSTQHLIYNPFAALFQEMGLGKTVSTLTAIDILQDRAEIGKVLVIAPLRVADMVWQAEIDKWDHLKHLTLSKILGSPKARKKALAAKANIYIINRENVVWLLAQLGGSFPFDLVVIDELSSFKSPSSARFKALKTIRPKIKRLWGLTGTPMTTGLHDLWSQLYLLDRGERLGKTMSQYTSTYFNPGQSKNHVVYNWTLKGTREKDKQDPVLQLLGTDIYEKEIFQKISDICISMKSEDYLDLPERIDRIVEVKLSNEERKAYHRFEEEQVMLFDDDVVTAVNAGVLTGKLLQFASGAIYLDPDEDEMASKPSKRIYKQVHTKKLEALEEIVDTATGSVLVAYWFQHDLARLKKRFPKGRALKTNKDFEDWNAGKIPVGFLHPASGGHGLNLQTGGHTVVWFSMIFSLELYQQLNKRLHRQGQEHRVIIHHLVIPGTMDTEAWERLVSREQGQSRLMAATKALIKRVRSETLV